VPKHPLYYYRMSPGLVQLAAVWCAGEPAEEGAVCAERCFSFVHQHTASRPHRSGFASTPLTASREMRGVQDCISGLRQQHRRTFNSSLSMVVVISAHLVIEHSLFHAHVPLSATEVLLSQDRVC